MQDNHEHRAPFPPNCMLATQWLASVSKPSAVLLKQHNHTRSIGALDCWSSHESPTLHGMCMLRSHTHKQ